MSDKEKRMDKKYKFVVLGPIIFIISLGLGLVYLQTQKKITTETKTEITTSIIPSIITIEKIITQNQTLSGTLLNILFTIMGGLIAGFAGILVEWWRRKIEIRDKHFQDIKTKCLEPILKQLLELRERYEFRDF